MWKATIVVTLRPSILDPQGSAVAGALKTVGYQEATTVRMGKYFEVTLDVADRQTAEQKVNEICAKVLANPVMEDYSFELMEV